MKFNVFYFNLNVFYIYGQVVLRHL